LGSDSPRLGQQGPLRESNVVAMQTCGVAAGLIGYVGFHADVAEIHYSRAQSLLMMRWEMKYGGASPS
jgi:hypothetical protein